MSDIQKGLAELSDLADRLEVMTNERIFGDLRDMFERMKGEEL